MAEKNGWTKWLIRILVVMIFGGIGTILLIQHKDLKAEASTRGETDASTLEKHIDVAKDSGLEFVYSGNVAGHDYENTYCPECGFKAVERYSVYLDSNNLDRDGNCPKCKTDLNIKGVQWMIQGKGQFKRF